MSSLQPNDRGDWVMLVLSAGVAVTLIVSIVVSECGGGGSGATGGERARETPAGRAGVPPGTSERESDGSTAPRPRAGGPVAVAADDDEEADRGSIRSRDERGSQAAAPSGVDSARPTAESRAGVPDLTGATRDEAPAVDDAGRASSDRGSAGGDAVSRGPVNDRVLGPRRWRRTLTDVQMGAVRRSLNRPGPRPEPIAGEDRNRAESAIRRVARRCFRSHAPTGASTQMTVEVRLRIDRARARLVEPAIPSSSGFSDPAFLACLRSNLQDRGFPARRDGRAVIREVLFLGAPPGRAGRP